MHYFAYGSNMSHQQMKQRCPNSRFIKKAYLKGYRFVYDGYSSKREGAVANIIETDKEKDVVWGGLYEINEEDLSALDRYEGYPNFYNRKEVTIYDEEGRFYTAKVYFREGEKAGKPSKKYREIIIQGAKDCNLPEDYIVNTL